MYILVYFRNKCKPLLLKHQGVEEKIEEVEAKEAIINDFKVRAPLVPPVELR